MIEILLTKNQLIDIESEVQKTRKASREGIPGMLLAQITVTGLMHVGFLPQETVLRMQDVRGEKNEEIDPWFNIKK